MLIFNSAAVWQSHTHSYAQLALIIEFIVENNVYPKSDVLIFA